MKKKEWVLVTGGSRGIGAAICLELARHDYKVGVHYNEQKEKAAEVVHKIKQLGGDAVAFQAQVANPEDVAKMFRSLDEVSNGVHALVCSAGVIQDVPLTGSEPGDFRRVLDVNVEGLVNCCRESAKRMISRRAGSIVNLSSVAGQRPGRGQSNYAASKGAVESFTKALAVELAPRGIRVNGVAPGVIDTDMTQAIQAMAKEEIEKKILLRRIGQPEQVARVVRFLLSDEADYVTGQIWNVDGGFKFE